MGYKSFANIFKLGISNPRNSETLNNQEIETENYKYMFSIKYPRVNDSLVPNHSERFLLLFTCH